MVRPRNVGTQHNEAGLSASGLYGGAGRSRGRRLWVSAIVPVPIVRSFLLLALFAFELTKPAIAQTADRAGAVLKQHCARCHEASALENPPAKGALGNILDLDALAAREDLVVPGDPDASRLYQIMLARHRPLLAFFGPIPGPSLSELQDVRDWIAGLDRATTKCPDRGPLTDEEIGELVKAWRKTFETQPDKPLRFISLAPLYNLCRSDDRLASYRDAVSTLLSRLGAARPRPTMDTVGEANALIAFRPADISMTPAAWDKVAGDAQGISGVVDADELAARVLSRIPASVSAAWDGQNGVNGAKAGRDMIDGLDPVRALASEYERTVTLRRAAAELARPTETLVGQLQTLSGTERDLGLRLAETGLPRAEWRVLKALLNQRPGAAPPESQSGDKLRLALWTGALSYKAGDLLTVYARPSGDCYLTLIAVESDGVATVLFPNDTNTDNRVSAGTLVQVPQPDAPFQIRLDKRGRQGIVGICNANARRPEGIGHDFERQRFTVLGNWRAFLGTTSEKEAAYLKTQEDMRRFRARRSSSAEPLAEQVPVGTEDEARAGLSVEVE